MNCKQGDLAIVVRVSPGNSNWMIGRIVVCKALDCARGRLGWEMEEPLWEPAPSINGWRYIDDFCLLPIRSCDADVQDESLSWLPVPGGRK